MQFLLYDLFQMLFTAAAPHDITVMSLQCVLQVEFITRYILDFSYLEDDVLVIGYVIQ